MPKGLAGPSARLGLGALVSVMFFTVSGGPFGLEGLIGSVGPGVALTLIVVTPIVYSLPEALLIGELASMLPVEGGYYQWVKRAFGRFWGFTNGWLSWTYSLIDMALYPVLFLQYLDFFLPNLGGVGRFVVALTVIWGATAMNLRGTRMVGVASSWFGLLVLLPFGVLSVIALSHWLGGSAPSHSLTQPFHAPGVSFIGALGIGIAQSIWNYSGWDNPSTIGGEIEDASRTYPRALFRTLPLVTLVYLLSVVPVLAVTDWKIWTDGSWPKLASSLAGSWLGVWISAVGLVSAFALFNALLLSYSRVPLVLARDGLLPGWLSKLDGRGTPRRAVIASSVMYSIFCLVPFASLLAVDVALYTFALTLEVLALVRLRRREPELRGPFRVPLGDRAVLALGMLPLLLIVLSIVLSIVGEGVGLWPVLGTLALALVGPLGYGIVTLRNRKTGAPSA